MTSSTSPSRGGEPTWAESSTSTSPGFAEVSGAATRGRLVFVAAFFVILFAAALFASAFFEVGFAVDFARVFFFAGTVSSFGGS
jgi:hypothetical protein